MRMQVADSCGSTTWGQGHEALLRGRGWASGLGGLRLQILGNGPF